MVTLGKAFILLLLASGITALLRHATPYDLDFRYLIDPSHSLELSQALAAPGDRWHAPDGRVPTLGYNPGRVWVRFDELPPGANSRLEYDYSQLQSGTFYRLRAGKILQQIEFGRRLPFSARGTNHRNFIFDLGVIGGAHAEAPTPVEEGRAKLSDEIVIRFESTGTVVLPFRVLTETQAIQRFQTEYLFFGTFFGLLFFLCLANGVVYLNTRVASFGLFALYALCSFFTQFTLYGFSYQFLWPRLVAFNLVSGVLFTALALGTLCLFAQSLLNAGAGRRSATLYYFAALAFAQAVLGTVFYNAFFIRATGALAVVIPVAIMVAAFREHRRLNAYAKYIFSGLALLLLGTLAYAFRDLGLLSHNVASAHGIIAGSIAELALFSFALAAQIKSYQRSQFAAEREAEVTSIKAENLALKLKEHQALTDLAQQVSHDIRSPLAALNVLVAMELRLPSDVLDLVKASIERMNRIANELLRQSSRASSPVAGTEPFSVREAVELTIRQKRVEYSRLRDVQIEVSTPTDPGEQLFAGVDRGAFSSILSNLVNNSVEARSPTKHSAQHPLEVRVSVSPGLERSIEVTVQDNGFGIAARDLQKIGTRGYSAKSKRGSEARINAGLGIFQAKQYLESAGGRLRIESREREGTRVTLMIPACESP